MPTYPVSLVGQHGIIRDVPAHMLPVNAWSNGNNVRFRNGFVEKILGQTPLFGTPSVAPYGVFSVSDGSNIFWVYTGLAAVYVVKDRVHTNITRSVGGAYTASINTPWMMTNFQGVPIFNNENDVPQMWTPISAVQVLQALSNWTSTWRTKSLRAFKQFLVAVNVTKGATTYPRMVKWSHGAASGAVPSSWDETDETIDAGEFELSGTMGHCMDSLPLGDTLIIYKEDAIWGMQYVGGTKVMRFFPLDEEVGIAGPRQVALLQSGRHIVLSTDDVFVFNGQTRKSILDERMRTTLFESINNDAFRRSFVVVNHLYREAWICVPTGSATLPNTALVWNWVENTLTLRDIPTIAHANFGYLPGFNLRITEDGRYRITEAGDTRAVESGLDWQTNAVARAVVLARPSSQNLLLADDTFQFETTDYESYVERTGLGIPFRAGQPPDISSMKLLTAVWPWIEGTDGGVVKVYVGSQDSPDGPVTYDAPFNYVIGTTKQVPTRRHGRVFALKFLSDSNVDWKLRGYDLDAKQIGRF